jgi:O-antigen/teichoic acid export membrane protein
MVEFGEYGSMISRQIKIGAFLNYLNMALGFVFTLFVLPFVIRGLGSEEFGLYCLIGVFSGYLDLLQFGMGGAIIRYVAKYNAEKDQAGRENFLAMVLLLYVISAILILVTGGVLITQLDNIFAASLTSLEAITKSREMFTILVVSVAICSITNVFVGALSGCEEFIFPRVLSAVSWCARILTTIAILTQNPTAVAITLLTASLAVISGLVNSAYALWKCKIRIKLHKWENDLFKEMIFFSAFIFMLEMAGLFYWKIGEIIVGAQISLAAVGVYSIGMHLNTLALQFTNSINNLLLPHATKIVAREASVQETTLFAAKVGRIILLLYGSIYIGFIFFGKLFITLWAGKEFEQAYYVTLIALTAVAIPRIQSGMNNIMKAKNMHGVPAIIFFLSSVFSAPIAWVFAKSFGLIGVVCAAAFGLIIGNVIIVNFYYVKRVGFDLLLFFKETFSGAWVVIAISAFACYAATYIKGYTFKTLIIQCAIHVVVYVVAVLVFGLNKSEKTALFLSTKKFGNLIGARWPT